MVQVGRQVEAAMSQGQRGSTQVGAAPGLAARLPRIILSALAIIVGVAAIVCGAALFLAARPAEPMRVDGIISDYRAVLAGGSYVRSELTLVNDPRTYTFDRGSFSPALPDSLYQSGQITVWTDGTGGAVIALTILDEHGLNATTYSMLAYDNPNAPLWMGEGEGLGAAALGLVLAVGVPLVLGRHGRRRGKSARQEASALRQGIARRQVADESLTTDRQAAVEMPAVVAPGRVAVAPAPAASAPPAPAGSHPAPNASLPRWRAGGPSGSLWEPPELMSGPTPGAPRVERTMPTFPPAPGPADAKPPAIDDLPTEHTPAASSPQVLRPQATPPVARSYPPADSTARGAPPALPRFGPAGPASSPDAGAYVPGQPWPGYAPAAPDLAASRPGTRLVPSEPPREPAGPSGGMGGDLTDAPTAPTQAVTPPSEQSDGGPRLPLWPPARDTNGQ
jgi:hypothetical protein